ncbi:MAG: Adenylate cyclase [Candidatus Rifleibacterium amylolyticum]|nr:MAG: Adenylate cyclase [Candidatus Rifleibacterium amylolyticum]
MGKLTDSIKSLVRSLHFGIFAGVAILLALTDAWFISSQTLAYGTRNLLLTIMLLILCLKEIEHFFIIAAAVQIPNLLLLLIFAVHFKSPGLFFGGMLGHVIISAIFFYFYWQLAQNYISESRVKSLKADLREADELYMQKLLYFSLLGCLRDKNRVLSQAYHVLEEFFKADKAIIYLADHEKNLLIPSFKPGTEPDRNFPPILVQPDFWRKHSYDPGKGMLSLIGGKTSLRTLKNMIPESSIDALAAMPLSADKIVTGLVVVFRQKEENRKYLDPAHFAAFAYVLGSAFENCQTNLICRQLLDKAVQKSEKVESALGKYVSGDVARNIIDNQANMALGGKKAKISVMMADLRGFTRLSGTIPIEGVVTLLNTWFERACTLIEKNGGHIDKFMGDGILVLFGAPKTGHDDTLRSVYTAFRLQEEFSRFMTLVKLPAGCSLGLSISISTGEAVVGNFGSKNRMEYTAIGETVNLAARIEKLAESNEIIVDETTFNQLPLDSFKFSMMPNVEIKGAATQNLYKLHALLKDDGN